MTEAPSCELCASSSELGLSRFGELALCPSCHSGNLSSGVPHAGIKIEARQMVSSRDTTMQVLDVTGRMISIQGGDAWFVPLGIVGKMMELFSRRARSGDDIYDAHVRGTGKNIRWVDQLIESDAVRTACLEVTTKDDAFLSVEGAEVRARAVGRHLDGNDLMEMTRAVAIVLRRIAVIEGRWNADVSAPKNQARPG